MEAYRGGEVLLPWINFGSQGYSGQEALVDCAAGWGEALTLLKVYLEKGWTYGEVPESDDRM